MSDRRDTLLFFYRRRPDDPGTGVRVSVRTLAFFGVMIILIGLAGWLYLHQAAEVAAYGHDIRRLENQRERLHREIIALRAEVAELGSLSRAHAWGAERGYRLPKPDDPTGSVIVEYVPIEAPTPTDSVPTRVLEGEGEPAAPVGLWSGPLGRILTRFQDWMEEPVEDGR